jgi:undecaprenyl-diphosphatase
VAASPGEGGGRGRVDATLPARVRLPSDPPVNAGQAAVLGVVQGLTEYLPISSTAHLRIVPAFCGWEDPGAAFTAVVQLGTMAAVVLYFWRDLWRIARVWLASLRRPHLRSTLDARMGWYVIIATIPIGIFGLIFQDQIEDEARGLALMGTTLIVFGLVLLAADRLGSKTRDVKSVGARDAVGVGLAQALALVPGVSRSGATISAAMALGLKREAAARFSFLLSVPAIVLSGVFELGKIVRGDEAQETGAGALILATFLAFVVGYASIAFLLRWLGSHTLTIFVVYRVVLGILVLSLLGAGLIS